MVKILTQREGITDMKKILATTVALVVLAIFTSSAQTAIKIETARVQNGVAYIQGNGAQLGAQITWEGGLVTTANNKNGGFSFFGVLPDDCTGVLSDGSQTGTVTVLNCTPVTAGVPAPVPQTGQTTCYNDVGTVISCAGTGQDGELQKGVAWPNPRFTDNGNGTITDNLTGLIWLHNANCFGLRSWAQALSDANGLASSSCGLNDGSVTGDWRLPNLNELTSLLDRGTFAPALSGNPFTDLQFQVSFYWSSTTYADRNYAWIMNFFDGFPNIGHKTESGSAPTQCYVIAVRGGS